MAVILTGRRGESFFHDVKKAELRWGGFVLWTGFLLNTYEWLDCSAKLQSSKRGSEG